MTVSLQSSLTHHKAILGENFENLGKKNWIYLSYDAHIGWNVCKYEGILGIFQQFLRWIGMAPSTNLATVANQIHKEANVPPALLAKINGCWQKQGHQVPAPIAAPVVPPAAAPVNRVSFQVGDTKVTIEEVDITKVQGVKAIVNAANPACLGGGGIDGAIHRAAGPALLAACRELPESAPGVRCRTGHAVITVSGDLAARGIDRVIHTVGPIYNPAEPMGSKELLRQAYTSCLELAHQNGLQTIAIPGISTGIYGFPADDAAEVALETVADYANVNPGRFTEIKLVYLAPQAAQTMAVLNRLQHPQTV